MEFKVPQKASPVNDFAQGPELSDRESANPAPRRRLDLPGRGWM
jgi:hypothetical protein